MGEERTNLAFCSLYSQQGYSHNEFSNTINPPLIVRENEKLKMNFVHLPKNLSQGNKYVYILSNIADYSFINNKEMQIIAGVCVNWSLSDNEQEEQLPSFDVVTSHFKLKPGVYNTLSFKIVDIFGNLIEQLPMSPSLSTSVFEENDERVYQDEIKELDSVLNQRFPDQFQKDNILLTETDYKHYKRKGLLPIISNRVKRNATTTTLSSNDIEKLEQIRKEAYLNHHMFTYIGFTIYGYFI